MKHNYTITGMTCNTCKATVEKKLTALPKVSNATANLETNTVTLNLKEHLSINELQKALPEKYKLSEAKKATPNKILVSKEKSTLKQLFPLFLIFAYLTVSAYLLNNTPWSTKRFMLDFMGLFFIVFSFFKFLDLKGFVQSFRMYDPLAKAIPSYAWVYPFIELILGICFLMRYVIPTALVVTLIILGITTFGVVKVLSDKKSIQCACLGAVLKLPMTKATFIENSIMIVMAIYMLTTVYN